MKMEMDGMDMKNGTDGGGGMDMGMHMFFYLSTHATILFEGWKSHTGSDMFGSCVAVYFMAVAYEALKVCREMLRRKYGYVVSVNLSKVHVPDNNTTAMVVETRGEGSGLRGKLCHWHHILQTFLHMVQITLSYFLMLIFMTYNGWLCIAVVLGAGTGYFLVGWKLTNIVDVYEHCH